MSAHVGSNLSVVLLSQVTIAPDGCLSPDTVVWISVDAFETPLARRLDAERGLLIPDLHATLEPTFLALLLLVRVGLPLALQNSADVLW